jgi:hypothetical protein
VVLACFLLPVPDKWRRHKPTAGMIGTVVGGTYGLFVWVQALTGGLDQAGFVFPKEPDAFAFILGIAGFASIFLTGWVLVAKYGLKRDIDLGEAQEQILVASAGVGILMLVLTSRLHLPK